MLSIRRKWTALAVAALSRHVDVVKVLIQNRADVNLVNIRNEAPIDIAVQRAQNDNDIHTVLYLFCIGRARITDRMIRMSKSSELSGILSSLCQQSDGSRRVFTKIERAFLYSFGFVLAKRYSGHGRKMFHSILAFMTHNGFFMSNIFCLGSRHLFFSRNE